MVKPTRRQMQVIQFLGEGLSNKEIAKKIGIGERTVKMHMEMVVKRLGLRNRTQLLIKSVKMGWI